MSCNYQSWKRKLKQVSINWVRLKKKQIYDSDLRQISSVIEAINII